MNNNLIASIAALMVSVVLYVVSAGGEGGGYEFPALIGLVMCGLAAGMLAYELGPGRRSKGEASGRIPWGSVLPGLVLFVAYLFLIERLGFFVTSFLVFLVIAALYAPGPQSPNRIARTAGIAGVFTATLYTVFVLLLQVQFPQGLLF